MSSFWQLYLKGLIELGGIAIFGRRIIRRRVRFLFVGGACRRVIKGVFCAAGEFAHGTGRDGSGLCC